MIHEGRLIYLSIIRIASSCQTLFFSISNCLVNSCTYGFKGEVAVRIPKTLTTCLTDGGLTPRIFCTMHANLSHFVLVMVTFIFMTSITNPIGMGWSNHILVFTKNKGFFRAYASNMHTVCHPDN